MPFFKNRRSALFIFIFLTAAVFFSAVFVSRSQKLFLLTNRAAETKNQNKPNILVFMIDDLSEDLFAQLLDAGKLPNIKKYLLDKGVTFRNSFVTDSICCPSRAAFLTGQYPHNNGVYNVVGVENGNKMDVHNNLAVWLDGAGYYKGNLGKYLNGPRGDGWDYWVQIKDYDPRPGMYRVLNGNMNFQPDKDYRPDMYEARYLVSETDLFLQEFNKEVKKGSKNNFFLTLNPHLPHVSVTPYWNKIWQNFQPAASYNGVADTSPVVGWTSFTHPTSLAYRQHLVRGPKDGRYHFYYRDLKTSRAKADEIDNSTPWIYVGTDLDLLTGTEPGPIVAWNAFVHPDTGEIRQQVIRGGPGNYKIYYRDLTANSPGWVLAGAESELFAGTGDKPIVSFSATALPDKNIYQTLLRGEGTMSSPYDRYDRYRLNNVWTTWKKAADLWDWETTAGQVIAVDLDTKIEDGYAMLYLTLLRQNPSSDYSLFESVERAFRIPRNFAYRGILGSDQMKKLARQGLMDTAYRKAPLISVSEEKQYNEQEIISDVMTGRLLAERAGNSVIYPHPVHSMRVFADYNWDGASSANQSFPAGLYAGNTSPAGSLRKDGPDGFTPIDSRFDLPGVVLQKPSVIKDADCQNKPPFLCETWPEIKEKVLGGRTQEDYLRRVHLDRLESMLSLDVMVGRTFSLLEEQNLLDSTIVIFTSDNGYLAGEHRLDNKMWPYEESIRVPLIIRKPGGGEPAGRVNTNTVLNIDLAPTLLEYAGLNWSDTRYGIDGSSLKSLLEDREKMHLPWRNSFLIEYRYPRSSDGRPSQDGRWFGAYMPDFTAVRFGQEWLGHQVENSLMAFYHGYPDRSVPGTGKDFIEYYQMTKDPYQTYNVYRQRKTLPLPGTKEDALPDGQKVSSIMNKMEMLQFCGEKSGQTSCREADRQLSLPAKIVF